MPHEFSRDWSNAREAADRLCAVCGKYEHEHEEREPDDHLGWWSISGDSLLDLLRRAHAGEDPDLLYAEEYANSDREDVD